jgi:hypothetical protein
MRYIISQTIDGDGAFPLVEWVIPRHFFNFPGEEWVKKGEKARPGETEGGKGAGGIIGIRHKARMMSGRRTTGGGDTRYGNGKCA